MSGAGDVNGDGKADLIVGAPGDDNNGFNSGSARVLSGADGSVLHNFDGDGERGQLGFSVSGAGDVNGDGKSDLIVGVPFDNSNGNISGSARVLSGSDGSVLHNFDGLNPTSQFGTSVSDAGDVDGDGTPDLVVGIPFDNDGNSNSARVFSGRDGSVLYNFNGVSQFDDFGKSVSGAGDLNGDGRADLVVGATSGRSARVFSGIDGSVLFSFNGSFDGFGDSVSGAGDVNGDGTPDLIVGEPGADNNDFNSGSAHVFSGVDGSELYIFNGDNGGDFFGNSVSGAGDVNGDGMADIIVGAPFDDNNWIDSGSARVLSGSNGSVLYNFDGDSAGDRFGWSVSGAGDVNGDGIEDLIVGAENGGANGGGYARVFVSQVLGDVNQDGDVDFLDISPFIAILSGGGFLGQADINQDGMVDFSDIGPFIALLSL